MHCLCSRHVQRLAWGRYRLYRVPSRELQRHSRQPFLHGVYPWDVQHRRHRRSDLHGLRSDEARDALGSFIREAHKQGIRCVRVVHGKGLGSPGKAPVLKEKVHRWLVQKAEVVAFVQAQPAQGGAGALVVLLQPVRRGTHGAA